MNTALGSGFRVRLFLARVAGAPPTAVAVLVHQRCGVPLRDIEPDDTLQTLLSAAESHTCPGPANESGNEADEEGIESPITPVPDEGHQSSEFELLREDRSGTKAPGKPGKVPIDVLSGYPPFPAAALPAFRHHVGERPRWSPRDPMVWAAVTELHRAGQHDMAVQLARFLHWVDEECDHWVFVVFELREAAPRRSVPAPDSARPDS